MSHALEQLLHHAREQLELIDQLTIHTIERDFTKMALDLSKLTANTTEISRIATAAQAGDSAAIQAAVAAQESTDQAAVDQATSDQSTALAPLTAEFPVPPAPEPAPTEEPAA